MEISFICQRIFIMINYILELHLEATVYLVTSTISIWMHFFLKFSILLWIRDRSGWSSLSSMNALVNALYLGKERDWLMKLSLLKQLLKDKETGLQTKACYWYWYHNRSLVSARFTHENYVFYYGPLWFIQVIEGLHWNC